MSAEVSPTIQKSENAETSLKINIDTTLEGFSEDKFNVLYDDLITNNSVNTGIKDLLPKPTDTDKKKQLYTILAITKDAIGNDYGTTGGKQKAQSVISLLCREIYQRLFYYHKESSIHQYFTLKKLSFNQKRLKVQIWDTAGHN